MLHRTEEPYTQTDGNFPRIFLVGGEHFSNRNNKISMFRAISKELGKLSLNQQSLLVAGYDASSDRQSSDSPRTTTHATTYKQFLVGSLSIRNTYGWPKMTYFYSGINGATPEQSPEPAIGFYDKEMMQPTGKYRQYSVIPGRSLDDAKVAEIHMVRSNEEWRIPQSPTALNNTCS